MHGTCGTGKVRPPSHSALNVMLFRVTRLCAHGTIHRYWKGCRCFRCKVAYADYVSFRRLAVREGASNGIVPADRVRAHLNWLRSSGAPLIRISRFTGISYTTICRVASGFKSRIREQSGRKLLAVQLSGNELVLRYDKIKTKNRLTAFVS